MTIIIMLYNLGWFVLAASFFVTVAGDCGFPGTPANGFLKPPPSDEETSWPAGSSAAYGCDKGYVLFGDLQRKCLDNNTWSGEVPTCDKNLALESKTSQSATFFNYTSSQAVDGHLDTCSFTPRTLDRRWWQVNLPETYTIAAVAVTISTGLIHKFTVFVVHVGTSGKLIYEPCGSFDGIFETDTVVLVCNQGRGQTGQVVFIRDDRTIFDYFGLCEVEVFRRRDNHPCGDPETPLNGDAVVIDPDGLVEFTCSRGRRIIGDSSHVCTEGRWVGIVPQCNEVTCEPPVEVPNGIIHVLTPGDEIIAGAVANHVCDEGYKLFGNSSRVCGDEGHWLGSIPSCEPISCGSPPSLSNGVIKVNSTSWGSVGILSCDDGFFASGSVETHCGNDGKWQNNNMSCQELYVALEADDTKAENSTDCLENTTATVYETSMTTMTVVGFLEDEQNQRGIAAAAASSDSGSYPFGVVVGSIVAIIATLVIFFLMAYLRRKWQARTTKNGIGGTESLKENRHSTNAYSNSHLVLPDGEEPLYDDIYANGGFRGDPLYADTLSQQQQDNDSEGNDEQRLYDRPASTEPIYYTPVEFSTPSVSQTVSRRLDDDESEENPAYEALDPVRLDAAIYAQVDFRKKQKDREESFRRQREHMETLQEERPRSSDEEEGPVYENVELEGGLRPLPPIPSETSLIAMEETMDNELYSSVAPDEPQDHDRWENSDSIYAALDLT